jgi:arylsulfatase A-like enzyme
MRPQQAKIDGDSPGKRGRSVSRRGFLRQLPPLAITGQSAPALLSAGLKRPNVLWLMTDEQRPDSFGCYKSPWANTPNLDRLARDGVLFESAYTPSPVCVPARSCLLTGQFGSTLDVLHNQQKLHETASFLTWAFEKEGYKTASFGKKHYFYPGRQAFQTEGGHGVDRVVSPTGYPARYNLHDFDVVQYPNVKRHIPGPRTTWILGGKYPESTDKMAEPENVKLAIGWLDKLDRSDNFLLRLSLNAPHTPVVVPESFLKAIKQDVIDLPFASDDELRLKPRYERQLLRDYEGSQVLSREQILKARHYYYARTAFVDFEIGRLLNWMHRRGLLDNTIVAFVSDHGTHLGDHGLVQKQTFYERVVTVAYFFWWREFQHKGIRLKNPVNTHTLLPTLLDLAGVEHGGNVEVRSLATNIRDGSEPPQQTVFSEIKFGYQGYRDNDRLVMVRDRRFKLVLFKDPHDPQRLQSSPDGSLYDLTNDPNEVQNLFGRAEWQGTVSRLRSEIDRWDNQRLARIARAARNAAGNTAHS